MNNPSKRKKVSEAKFLEWSKNVPGTLRGGGKWPSTSGSLSRRIREQLREQGPSFGSAATPDDSSAQVSHADRKGTRSLKGRMVHRFPKTLRGKSVVPDKPDRVEDEGSK